jgi:hypothetical protein
MTNLILSHPLDAICSPSWNIYIFSPTTGCDVDQYLEVALRKGDFERFGVDMFRVVQKPAQYEIVASGWGPHTRRCGAL